MLSMTKLAFQSIPRPQTKTTWKHQIKQSKVDMHLLPVM